MVIGSYDKSFMAKLIPAQNWPNFCNFFKKKNGKLGFISMTQKTDTIIDFYPMSLTGEIVVP